jgi:hypothetical protein
MRRQLVRSPNRPTTGMLLSGFEAFAPAVGRMRTVAECLRVSDKRPLLHHSVSACSVALPRVRMSAGTALVKCRLAFDSMLCGYARRRRDLCSCMKMWFICSNLGSAARSAA